MKLSPTENAMFLREIYDLIFQTSTYTDKLTDNLYGSVLFRESENLEDVSEYKYLLRKYHNLSIKKYTGYTFKDYLSMTPYEMNMVDDQVTAIAEEEREYIENLKKENEENNKNKSAATKSMYGYNNSLDDLLKELTGED